MIGPERGSVRRTDPDTAAEAARLVRPGSARHRLLVAHDEHPGGLTDEQAATLAHLKLTSEYATRCSELERAGYLVNTDDTRTGASGMARLVRRITPEGIAALRAAAPELDGRARCPKCGRELADLRSTVSPMVVDGRCLTDGRFVVRIR